MFFEGIGDRWCVVFFDFIIFFLRCFLVCLICGELVGLFFKLDLCFLWIWFNVKGVFFVFFNWLWWLIFGCVNDGKFGVILVENCEFVDVEGLFGREFVEGNFICFFERFLGIMRLFFFIELCRILFVLIVCVLIVLFNICFFFGVSFLEELWWIFGEFEFELVFEWFLELFFLFFFMNFIIGVLKKNGRFS